MKEFYEKKTLALSLILIAVYVVVCSFADGLSSDIGIAKLVTAPAAIVLTAALYFLIAKLGIKKTCGLCPWKGEAKDYGFFLPLVVLLSSQIWLGVRMNYSPLVSLLYVVSMLCVGFLEEAIFRGFLFNAILRKDTPFSAILIAGVTFGMGHIVNLLNSMEIAENLIQLVYASAIGVMLTVVFYVSGSLWPCILFHSFYNSLSTFRVAGTSVYEHTLCLVVIPLICIVYIAFLFKKWKRPQA